MSNMIFQAPQFASEESAAFRQSSVSFNQYAWGNVSECERIMDSLSSSASTIESQIEALIRFENACFDHDGALSVLGKLVPLQKRLQRMHSRLLEIGRKVEASSGLSHRDVDVLLQQWIPATPVAPIGGPIVWGQTNSEQRPVPCREVAILTFGRWTKKSTEVLQRAGLIRDRGRYGCHYLVHLLPFQKEYLELIRRPCHYHVIVEERRIPEVVAVVGLLSCADRGRLKKQEVVDLPTTEDEQMPEQPNAAGCLASSPASATSCVGQSQASGSDLCGNGFQFEVDQPCGSSWEGDQTCDQAWGVYQPCGASWQEASVRDDDQHGTRAVGQFEAGPSNETCFATWTVLGSASF